MRLAIYPIRRPAGGPRPPHGPRAKEEREERFRRLKTEFYEAPDEARMERMLEAFWRWRQRGLDSRCIAFGDELACLERDAKRAIAEREARERSAV